MSFIRIYIIITITCISIISNTFAQSPSIYADSILTAFSNTRTGTGKVNLALAFVKSIDIDCKDSVIYTKLLNNATIAAEQAKWQEGLIEIYHLLGGINRMCRNDYMQFKYYNKALAIAKNINDTAAQIKVLTNISNAYQTMAQYSNALNSYMQYAELINDPFEKIGLLGNIGSIYSKVGNYPLSFIYYDSSLRVLNEYLQKSKTRDITDTAQLCGLWINIGAIYNSMTEYDKAQENYQKVLKINVSDASTKRMFDVWALLGIAMTHESKKEYRNAILYYSRALEASKLCNLNTDEVTILNKLGDINMEMGMLDTAMAYARRALSLAEINNIKESNAALYGTIGKIFTKLGKYDSSEYYLKQALDASKESNSLDFEKDAWHALSIVYEKTNKYELSLAAYKNYIATRDSVYNIKKANELTRMDLQSEYDRQKQITTAENELRVQKQRVLIYSGFAGLILVLALLFFIYRNYSQQKKANIIITEEKEKAEALRKRAELSEQYKQQFLANMSHEIRTPMNAVNGMTDLLLEKNPRPDQLKYLTVISKSSDILLHIINDILDISKIEAGKLDLEKIDFSLSESIQLVNDTLSIRAEEKGLQLTCNIADDVTDVVEGDPYRLNQILINLGGNAIKFTERGSVLIEVKKTKDEEKVQTLLFSVTDTGAGIPEEKLSKLFDSFTQVNSSDTRKHGGTGLGLSISQQLVAMQGGTISVESKLDTGTVFSFSLTIAKGSAEQLAQRIYKEQKAEGTVLNGLRILLADDNEYNRLVVCEALRNKAEVKIHEALDGLQVIELMQTNEYDVVLMDVQMPIMNGLDATRFIRDKMPSPKNTTPIIALTASMLRNDIDRCINAGMNTCVPKPFKLWQLVSAIASVTGRKQTLASAPTIVDKPATIVGTQDDDITNLSDLATFCDGEKDRMKIYINKYLNALAIFEEKISAGIATEDTEEVSFLVHSFKPKWMMMGMKKSKEIAGKIEALHEQQSDKQQIFAHAMQLLAQNKQSVAELERFI